MNRPRHLMILTSLLAVAIVLAQASVFLQSRTGRDDILRGTDPLYYYGVARSVVFDFDLDITNDIAMTPVVSNSVGEPVYESFRTAAKGGRITSPYGIGTSILSIPWLAGGTALRNLAGYFGWHSEAPPGYSAIEIQSVCTGLIWYTLCGLYCAALLLKPVVSLPVGTAIAACGWIATNLFYYSVISPFMAHGPAFLFIGLSILWATKISARSNWQVVDFAILGTLAGFLYLIRPQQVLLFAVLIPMLVGAALLDTRKPVEALLRPSSTRGAWLTDYMRALLQAGREHAGRLSLVLGAFSLAFAVVAALQLLHNFNQFDGLLVNPYESRNERFHWLVPQFYPVLFQPDRGLFVIQPLAILAVLGFASAWRKWSITTFTFMTHGLVQAYVVACWAFPGSGTDPFGPRLWCECAGTIVVGLGLLIRRANSRAQIGLAVAAAAACAAWTLSLLAAKPTLIGLDTYSEVVSLALRPILP